MVARAGRSSTVVAKAAAMVCVDCGYIYDGDDAFEKLPSNFKCPVCSSPKKRSARIRGL